MRKLLSLVSLAAVTVLACASESPRTGFDTTPDTATPGEGTPSGGITGNGQVAGEDPKANECQKMDLLFVVDDSGSMKEEQSNLAANFPKFVEKLNAYKTKSGASLDWRVAVTTTGRSVKWKAQPPGFQPIAFDEKGDDGAFRTGGKCGATKRWVDKSDPGAAQTFACLAQVGTSGPGYEMPLIAAKMALVDRVSDGTNAGFVREDALLAIVILSDEDDCSREDNDFTAQSDRDCTGAGVRPVGIYNKVFDDVAKGAGRWAAAVIAGPNDCKSSFGEARTASRLQEFVSLAGKNGIFSSICEGDLTKGLDAALANFDAACKSFPGVR